MSKFDARVGFGCDATKCSGWPRRGGSSSHPPYALPSPAISSAHAVPTSNCTCLLCSTGRVARRRPHDCTLPPPRCKLLHLIQKIELFDSRQTNMDSKKRRIERVTHPCNGGSSNDPTPSERWRVHHDCRRGNGHGRRRPSRGAHPDRVGQASDRVEGLEGWIQFRLKNVT